MTFSCIHRSVPCRAIIKEVFFCNRWAHVQRPTAIQYAENEKPLNNQLYLTSPSSFFPEGQGTLQKRTQKECRNQRELEAPRKQSLLSVTHANMNSQRPRLNAQGIHKFVLDGVLEVRAELATSLHP